MHLNLFAMDVGHHEGAWRLPSADPHAGVDFGHYRRLASMAEGASFDSVFFADSLNLNPDPEFRLSGTLAPLALMAALAVVTERIGLIGTASTTFSEPFNLARQFASVDHLSGGRVGWNMVTTSDDRSAQNFGLAAQQSYGERYERADEFLEVVKRLWTSWDADAIVADKEAGVFAPADRLHPLDHVGRFYSVRGPLNLPRSPQVFPVLVQAGSSEAGRSFAARHAEAIFTAQPTLTDAQSFYADIRKRVTAAGRDPRKVKVLPGLVPVVGATEAEAKALELELGHLTTPERGLVFLSSLLGQDLTDSDIDAPLPALPSGFRSRSDLIEGMAKAEDLTVRDVLTRLSFGRGHFVVVGAPEQIADVMERWFREDGSDGFNVMPPVLPDSFASFIDHVVPILRRRGLFREGYEESTLRGHYGLDRPSDAKLIVDQATG